MRVTFSRRKKLLKIISLMLAAGFLTTSVYAGADSRLRPTAVGNSRKKMSVLQDEIISKGKRDGGSSVIAASSLVKIFAENVIVSDGKGADVGRTLRLEKLIEEKLDGALLGHSNTRKTFIKEFSKGNSRDNAFLRFDQIMNHRILAQIKAGLTEISLCVGSDRDNLPVEEEIADVLKQLLVSLSGVTQEQLKEKTFNFAWEPAGNIGTGVAEGPEKIRIVHQAIYEWFVHIYGEDVTKQVWGKSLRLLYGASVDGKNVDGIMAVKSTKPGIEGAQLVHGVLFASSGKKVEGFLEVAYGVNRAAVRDNAQYVTFINLKEFLAKDKTPMIDYIGEIYQAVMAKKITPANNLIYIADQDVHLKRWQRAIRLAEASYEGYEDDSAVSTIPGINTFGRAELNGLRVLLRLDLNVSDDAGKIKSEKRIQEAMDTIAYYIENGATVIISSHNSRPKGKVNKKLSLGPNEETKDGVSLRIEKLLREKGYDTKVIFHPDSVTDKGVKPGLRNEIVEGAVNVIENVRFAKGEEKNYESFYKDMASLADFEHFDFDAFGAGERPDAVSSAKYMQSISQGLLMEKEDRYLKNALEVNYGLISGGGPKVSEKLPVLKNVIANKKKPGGFAIFGTAPATFFLDALYGIKLGDSKSTDEKKIKSRQDNIEQVKEIIRLAEENKMNLVLPIDFVAVNRDLTETAEGENNWIALKKIPEGAKIIKVTLEQLKAGRFLDENNNEVLASDIFLYDIGEQTKELFKKTILSTPKGMSIFYNGTVGVFEMPLFASGGKAVDEALAEATRNGVITVIGGGDTGKEAEKNKVDKLVTHVSTGGGASAAVLKGEELSAIKLLNIAQSAVKSRMENLNVSIKEFMRYLVADKAVFKAMGGEFFRKYIRNLVQGQVIKDGDLSKAQITSERTEDSRKYATMRVRIKMGDIEVIGEVPAGASTGEDEAEVASPDAFIDNVKEKIKDEKKARAEASVLQAKKNIEEIIVPLLTKSGLDLSRHEDLKQAEKLIIKAAGKNYKDLGANAVVPMSWALWRAAAKLHNMELWEYIRWYEPQVVGKNDVAFYSNVYNGGLHAKKEGETLGTDRIDIQEVMVVVLGSRSAAEKLEMDDKIDQELKKLLVLEAKQMGKPIESLTRADEAGFSLKGLGSSERAIELVAQAITNAGYKPGVDVQLALDPAASTFAREVNGQYVYDFQGQELTGRQMIDFYISLAKKYPGLIRSIEDGLAENDWDNWVILTAEMKKFGILTIGDDLFVTQMDRLKKGVAMKAASAILIKVNQNGSVSGTLEVIQYAMEHGLEIVVSHRSGETLDPAIADLAYAVKAMGLKTGAPQPAADFSDPETLVRRVKYERLITIEENPYLSGKVLLVNENFFSSAASRTSLSMVAELADSIKIAVYGKNAEKLKILLGSDNVVVADDFGAALASLENLGVAKDNMLLLDSAVSSQDISAANAAGIRQVVAKDLSVVAVAKAVKDLVQSNAGNVVFQEFFQSIEDAKIMEASAQTKQELLDKLAQGTFELPSDLKLTVSQDVAEEVLKAQASVSEFMTRV